jgi:hypothetical protein
MLKVQWVLLNGKLPISELALKGRGITLEDVELGLLDHVCILLEVLAATATTLRATVDPLGKALTVEFETLGLRAAALGSRADPCHGVLLEHFHLWTRRWLDYVGHWHLLVGKVLPLSFSAIFVHE